MARNIIQHEFNTANKISFHLDKNYLNFLGELKEKIKTARLRAALAVNHEVISLYWNIGKQIIEKQSQVKWGSKFIEKLSQDLQSAFPETSGFSKKNLERMRRFTPVIPLLLNLRHES